MMMVLLKAGGENISNFMQKHVLHAQLRPRIVMMTNMARRGVLVTGISTRLMLLLDKLWPNLTYLVLFLWATLGACSLWL
jgi:hypothetical protein